MGEDVVRRQVNELPAAHPMRELDLREDDERQHDRAGDARAEKGDEAVEPQDGGESERDPAVESHDGRRANERPERERQG